jgi:hypothetical protein
VIDEPDVPLDDGSDDGRGAADIGDYGVLVGGRCRFGYLTLRAVGVRVIKR